MGNRILFVDDDDHWHAVVTAWMEDAGYEVLTAKDGSEAMTQTEGVEVAVAVLDLDLAGEDGVMLMRFLKENNPELPVILFTGKDHDGEAIMALLQEGAHAYVRKGSQQELLQAVELALK